MPVRSRGLKLNFNRVYLEFLIFYILCIVNTSSGSLQWRSTEDPSGIELCRRFCHGSNTTTSCNKHGHGANETTSGRCCVNKGVVVGLDLSNCTLKMMPSLETVKNLTWLYLQSNPNLKCDDKTFLNSFKGLKNLSEVILPSSCNCTGGNNLWKNSSINGFERWCEGQRKDACKVLNVTCPNNADCFPNGPGFAECLCQAGWVGYKCLVKHGFPWATVFASIGATTLFVIVVLLLHQRKRRKENAAGYTQWQ